MTRNEDSGLMVCDPMSFGENLQTFRKNGITFIFKVDLFLNICGYVTRYNRKQNVIRC
jgi:hypothetical protein